MIKNGSSNRRGPTGYRTVFSVFRSRFSKCGSGFRLLLNSVRIQYGFGYTPRLFISKTIFSLNQKRYICLLKLNLVKGLSGSRRSLQPNRELFKQEISSFFPFFGDNLGLSGSGSGSETLLYLLNFFYPVLVTVQYCYSRFSYVQLRFLFLLKKLARKDSRPEPPRQCASISSLNILKWQN